MKIRSFTHQILLLIAVYSPWIHSSKDFIFDLGGVLVLTNKIVSFRHVGMRNILSCSFKLGINPFTIDHYIKSKLFTILDDIALLNQLTILDLHQTYDEKGNKLPVLINAWLQGELEGTYITTLVKEGIAAHPEWFRCEAEKRTVSSALELIFTPELLVNSRKISSAGISFIKKCKREGHRVYALSNWDGISFVLLKKRFPELFDLFDGIVVSGHVKANKPHAQIYQILLDRYELQPENCWFIDDQQENIDAAKKLGINAIRHTSTFKKLIENIRRAHKLIISNAPACDSEKF